jgi:hypothetical protein
LTKGIDRRPSFADVHRLQDESDANAALGKLKGMARA